MADEIDRTGVIRESYRIEGITPAQCRSIFLDWALSLPMGADQGAAIRALLARHGAEADHPMTAVLKAGLESATHTGRRGGRAARHAN